MPEARESKSYVAPPFRSNFEPGSRPRCYSLQDVLDSQSGPPVDLPMHLFKSINSQPVPVTRKDYDKILRDAISLAEEQCADHASLPRERAA